ncbi:chemotaxis protein CheW [Vibrio vulnificus]|nr:chemotaxis protein CheW [Vibrio vulnificus]
MSEVLPALPLTDGQELSGLLLVNVAGLPFAIEIDAIREVIEYRKLTRVPLCPEMISGVINVRGRVVPVIDAAIRLDLEQVTHANKYSCIILYEFKDEVGPENTVLGLLVDRVKSIEAVEKIETRPKPAFGCHVAEAFIEQMISVDNQFVPVLSMDNVLSVSQLSDMVRAFTLPYVSLVKRR